jgi:hypothetical protein
MRPADVMLFLHRPQVAESPRSKQSDTVNDCKSQELGAASEIELLFIFDVWGMRNDLRGPLRVENGLFLGEGGGGVVTVVTRAKALPLFGFGLSSFSFN